MDTLSTRAHTHTHTHTHTYTHILHYFKRERFPETCFLETCFWTGWFWTFLNPCSLWLPVLDKSFSIFSSFSLRAPSSWGSFVHWVWSFNKWRLWECMARRREERKIEQHLLRVSLCRAPSGLLIFAPEVRDRWWGTLASNGGRECRRTLVLILTRESSLLQIVWQFPGIFSDQAPSKLDILFRFSLFLSFWGPGNLK